MSGIQLCNARSRGVTNTVRIAGQRASDVGAQACNDFLQRIVGDRVNQSDLECKCGSYLLGGAEHLQGASFADEPWQTLCAAPSGDQPQRSPAVPEDCVWGGHAVVAGKSQVESAAQAVALDGGIDRGRKLIDRLHESLPSLGELIGWGSAEGSNLVQVCPGGEKVFVAGEDEGFGILSQVKYHFGECADSRPGKPISGILGSQPNQKKMTVLF